MKRSRTKSYTLCKDIGEIRLSSDSVRIQKEEGESGTAPFTRWIGEKADEHCADGLCSSGECDGHTRDTSVSVLAETDEYVDVSFRATLICECG